MQNTKVLNLNNMEYTHIAVINGRKRGVFVDTRKVIAYTQDYPNAKFVTCSSKEEALEVFKQGRPIIRLGTGIVDDNPEFPPIW